MGGHLYEAVLFQAASLLTFFGTLRISEVVATGKGNATKVTLYYIMLAPSYIYKSYVL